MAGEEVLVEMQQQTAIMEVAEAVVPISKLVVLVVREATEVTDRRMMAYTSQEEAEEETVP